MKTAFTHERKPEITQEQEHFPKQHFQVNPQYSKYLGHFVLQLNKPTALALVIRR